MVPDVSERSSLASGTDGISRPSQEHRDLGDVEWAGAVLEHLWNKTAVHGRGPLVILRPFRSYAAHQTLALTLHRLRRLLRDDGAVRRYEGKLDLDPNRVWTDVAALEDRLDRIDRASAEDHTRLIDAALRLYRGPLFHSDDEAWIVSRRDRLSGRFMLTIETRLTS